MPFKKGQPAGPGRPEGSKNKNFLVPSMWLGLLWDDVQDMQPDDRIPHIKWAVEQMMPKIPNIAATPQESLTKADAAWASMNGLVPAIPPLESNPGTNGGPPVVHSEGVNGS